MVVDDYLKNRFWSMEEKQLLLSFGLSRKRRSITMLTDESDKASLKLDPQFWLLTSEFGLQIL
jgi:hypothetical protein